jgi:hypothetical protein
MKNQHLSTSFSTPKRREKVSRVRKRRGAENRVVIVGTADMTKVEAAMREWLAPLLADRFLAENYQRSPTLGDERLPK